MNDINASFVLQSGYLVFMSEHSPLRNQHNVWPVPLLVIQFTHKSAPSIVLTAFFCLAVQLGFALVSTHTSWHDLFRIKALIALVCRHVAITCVAVQRADAICALQLTIGSVRAKSAKSVALKNIMDAAFGGVGCVARLHWGMQSVAQDSAATKV